MENPKEETLEEVAEKYAKELYENKFGAEAIIMIDNAEIDFIAGAKWQQEQNKNLYSEEEIINALHSAELKYNRDLSKIYQCMKEWLEQFKKK